MINIKDIKYIPFDNDRVINGGDSIKIRISGKTLILNLKKFKYSERYFIDIYDVSYVPISKNVMLSSSMDIFLGLIDERLPTDVVLTALPINEAGLQNDLIYPSLGKDFLISVLKRDVK